MGRFILRFKGNGPKPANDVECLRALRNATVLDDSTPRMILIEAPDTELYELISTMPGWVISKEKTISLPDTRLATDKKGE